MLLLFEVRRSLGAGKAARKLLPSSSSLEALKGLDLLTTSFSAHAAVLDVVFLWHRFTHKCLVEEIHAQTLADGLFWHSEAFHARWKPGSQVFPRAESWVPRKYMAMNGHLYETAAAEQGVEAPHSDFFVGHNMSALPPESFMAMKQLRAVLKEA